MLKLENSIRGLSFSRVAFDLTIQDVIYLFIDVTVVIKIETYLNTCVCII